MSFSVRDLTLDKVAVIGSGQIGPDIALHFTKVLAPHGVPVVVVDISGEALERGMKRLTKKVNKGRESGAFKPEQADAMLDNVTFTTDYAALKGASLVVEAATEDVGIKQRIFQQVRELCPAAVLASNSSHLEPEMIFAELPERSRTLVIHYFFPAERNLLVELVPGKDTYDALVDSLLALYEAIGKVPIRVESRYGYAVDPVFEGLFLAAALLVEAGYGSVKEVDAAAARILGLAVGPFTAMNLTGGNPITYHGIKVMHDKFGPWWRVPEMLEQAVATGEAWPVAGRGESVELDEEREQAIAQRMLGAYFGLVGQVLDSGITNVADYEMALELALDIRPAFSLMNETGVERSLELVQRYAAEFTDFPVPRCLEQQAASTNKPWRIDLVQRHDLGDVAVLTIRRPKVLNALNETVYEQLAEHANAIRNDANITAAVLTGFGTKTFVSGADVGFLAKLETPVQAYETSQASQAVGNQFENLGKPVVCALNGSAIGGGLELAMCCTARICRAGLKLAAQQPEVNLGIIPGAGGTQRLPRLVGVELAAQMLRTGLPLSSEKARKAGLVQREVEPQRDLLAEAVLYARDLASGADTATPINTGPLEVPQTLPEVELGHLSQAIDRILLRAIQEGCAKPLAEGLKLESQLFADCCRTEDMKRGLQTFLNKGPRAKAEFVHA